MFVRIKRKQHYILCVILSLAIIYIFISYQIGTVNLGYTETLHSQRAHMCFKKFNRNITLEPIACYLSISSIPCNSTSNDTNQNDKIILFEDIFEAEKTPTPGRSIFFVDTSCAENGVAALTARQACSIEAAARWNPQRDVYVLFASQVGFGNSSSLIMEALRSYENVHFRRINFREFSVGTPAEEFFAKDTIFESKFLRETFSDVLRLIALYHFGGVYFDLDVVVQKDLDYYLPDNFAGREISTFLCNAVFGFNRNGVGHKILKILIRNVCANFDPKVWGNTGPQALTRTMKEICNVELVTNMSPEKCWGFDVLSEKVFYPIYGTEWERYFDANYTYEALDASYQSVAVHFWNALSAYQPILKDFNNQTLVEMYKQRLTKNPKIQNPIGETAYGIIAKTNCPHSYLASGDLF